MTGFLARRLLQLLAVVFVVTIALFVLLHLLPGGPGRAVLPATARPAQVAAYNRQMGYDKPLPLQYVDFIGRLVHLNFGYSYVQNESVNALLAQRLPRTLVLAVLALLVGWILGLPLGVYQALKHGSRKDHAITYLTFLLWGTPAFFLAVVLIMLFSVKLHWLPPEGPQGASVGSILSQPRALVLPVVTLAVGNLIYSSRFLRSSVMDVLVQDYVRTARAKGADERRVIVRHVLRNALLPLATLTGFSLPMLFGGAVIVEDVFNYPGMGLLFLQSAQTYDYPVVLAVALIGAVMVVLGNLIADLLYAALDPRITYRTD